GEGGRVEMVERPTTEANNNVAWTLRGVTSNVRYTNQNEATALAERQQGLGRPAATRAALIPIRKNEAWWALAQDERRAIFEERSHHIAIGLEYLPAVSRRLHHGHDLGEPFDFLTWFEYSPGDANAFDGLVRRLAIPKDCAFGFLAARFPDARWFPRRVRRRPATCLCP